MKALLLLPLLLAGCISGTAQVNDLCDTHSVSFPATGNIPSAGIITNTQSFTISVGAASTWVSKLILVSGVLTASNGSFDFLDELTISIKDPNGTEDVVLWDASGAALDTDTLGVEGSDVNLVKLIDSNNELTINVVVSSGTSLPSVDWTLTADLCVDGAVSKTISL
jgi:hypothetical protein